MPRNKVQVLRPARIALCQSSASERLLPASSHWLLTVTHWRGGQIFSGPTCAWSGPTAPAAAITSRTDLGHSACSPGRAGSAAIRAMMDGRPGKGMIAARRSHACLGALSVPVRDAARHQRKQGMTGAGRPDRQFPAQARLTLADGTVRSTVGHRRLPCARTTSGNVGVLGGDLQLLA